MKTLTSAALTCSLIALCSAAWAEITITDLRDRTVTLDAPAEKVLLGFYYEDYLAVAGDGAVDKLVGLSRGPWAVGRLAANAMDGLHPDLPAAGRFARCGRHRKQHVFH